MYIILYTQNLALKIKSVNKKKHDANFKDLIADLKSARKSKLEKNNPQTRYFQKKIT